ncbi:acyl carrier protein [Frankia sp. Cr1]|uniref:acyl carrier protein n=1 Tax=Frankia sp. Cr1 TaxID=3073931 RepID=UPI002AD342D7|nr:acyl carrier protein [Frankia sp. Cr1]
MTDHEVTEKLVAFIQENLLPDDQDDIMVDETTPLLDLGVLDSLKTAILLNFIRRELKVEVPPQALSARNFIDVRNITNMITSLEVTATNS